MNEAVLRAALSGECPNLEPAHLQLSWAALGLDSFGLLTARAAIEDAFDCEISDADWIAAERPIDLLSRLGAARASVGGSTTGINLSETIEIALPQMAMSGLSEAWLMRYLGDVHWRLVSRAFRCPMPEITDESGDRLYAAFSRVQFRCSSALADFQEGEPLSVEASLSRHGTTLFFSDIRLAGAEGRTIDAALMSSFTRRGASPSNADLARGQPALSRNLVVPALAALPEIARGYRDRRAARHDARSILADGRYRIEPHRDINGVGLLYCAEYPAIADSCAMRARPDGVDWLLSTSIVSRDVCYYGNADPRDVIEWRLHEEAQRPETMRFETLRRADGAVIADLLSMRVPR